MAQIPITIYKNSPLATFCSIFGAICCLIAAFIIYNFHNFIGFLFLIIGGILIFSASAIDERVRFKKFLTVIKENGIENDIRNSSEIAIQIYKKFPSKLTLKYFDEINPKASSLIRNAIKNNK